MAQFMILMMGIPDPDSNKSQEEFEAEMQQWFAWDKELQESGIVISGEALDTTTAKTIVGKDKEVKNGLASDNPDFSVGGYYLIEAEDMDAAVEIAKGCPSFELDNGTVEVREVSVFDEE